MISLIKVLGFSSLLFYSRGFRVYVVVEGFANDLNWVIRAGMVAWAAGQIMLSAMMRTA